VRNKFSPETMWSHDVNKVSSLLFMSAVNLIDMAIPRDMMLLRLSAFMLSVIKQWIVVKFLPIDRSVATMGRYDVISGPRRFLIKCIN
jgi:hypothetical protein